MIRHIVMWRVRGDSPAERQANIATVQAAFEALRGNIPGLHRLEVGRDISGADYACDLVLLTDFDDAAALVAYASHPAHLRARDAVGNLRVERHQVDYVVA